jgi:hypothetical protein
VRRTLIATACAAIVGITVAPASAANCTLTTSGLSFGSYDVFSPQPTTTVGSVTVTCRNITVDIPIEISLSAGSAGSLQRSMTRVGGGPDRLRYNVYLGGQIFGDFSGGARYDRVAQHGTPVFTDRIALTAVIPPRQDVSVGQYQDSLVLHLDL